MKIGITVNADIDEPQGVTARAEEIFRALKRTCDTTLIVRGSRFSDRKDIIIINSPLKGVWNLRLLSIIAQNKFDFIYCVQDTWGFLSSYLLSKLFRYRVIYETHGLFPDDQKMPKSLQCAESFAVKHAHRVITLSEERLEAHQKNSKNVSMIPLFIDESIFKETDEIGRQKSEGKYGEIGIIGPFYQGQNSGTLEFLYENLDKFHAKFKFIIIGRCDNRIKDERISYTGYLPSITDYARVLSKLDAVLNYETLLQQAAAALCRQLPENERPPLKLMALHIWTMSHGVASLFIQEDSAAKKVPLSPEEVLESGLLIYLKGLGVLPEAEGEGASAEQS